MTKITVHHSTRLTAAKCLHRAGFLSSAPEGLVGTAIAVLIVVIIVLTFCLRFKARPATEEEKTPGAAATTSTDPENGESENAPPPYEPPASSAPAAESRSNMPVVDFPNPKDTAPAFVTGTILFAAQVFCLVTLAFCIQHVNYCPKVDPAAKLSTGSIIGWCFYATLVLFASSGLISWGLLCYYVAGGKKQDLTLDFIPFAISVVVCMPFVVFYLGAVDIVRRCQKWFCGLGLEEEEDNVVEEVETDVEMQRLMKGNDNNDDYDEEEEVGGRG
ncbi:hypothetical protein V494_07530 [Pseudogymnoascus sp. VKM F-4513 (FW-928)]|nr:hypothetical protein V494_07530 [Pseudogymnoascus sp. VKM F-4513 (FW-928)]